MQDAELLREYVTSRSDTAFAELVDRYVDFVYSTARRQLGNAQLAEEVAQVVFSLLARKAVGLLDLPSLAGWLYRATSFTAAKASRAEKRRRFHEQEAASMNQLDATDDGVWEHLSPMLDDALKHLEEQDRLAVFFRFFQKKPMREVGEMLGVSEAAAKMRVGRAVERLREFFSKRGVPVGASGLVAVLSANAVQSAPIGLSATISASAALSGAVHAGTIGLTKTLAMTTMQKTFVAATVAAAVGTGIYEARRVFDLQDQVQALQRQPSPLAEQTETLRRQRDAAASQLTTWQQENQRLRRDTTELAKLRGEVARLRADSQELAQIKTADMQKENDPTETAMKSWLSRVSLLKQRLTEKPVAKIPEFQVLTEQDWLDVARDSLETETDYRKAMSKLRTAAERKAGSMLQAALNRYLQANHSEVPNDLSQVGPYLDHPLDEAIVQRWEIAPSERVPNVRLDGDWILTQRFAVDEEYDLRLVFGPNGSSGSTDFRRQSQATAK